MERSEEEEGKEIHVAMTWRAQSGSQRSAHGNLTGKTAREWSGCLAVAFRACMWLHLRPDAI